MEISKKMINIKQAREKAWNYAKQQEIDGIQQLISIFEDKFAELIVRECADVATINAHQWESPGTYVLKHFGVEE